MPTQSNILSINNPPNASKMVGYTSKNSTFRDEKIALKITCAI
jgi:hypothetical protein